MRKCQTGVLLRQKPCEECKCRMWLDYEEDLNCTLVALQKHGPMTLEEIGKRHHISTVRVKQIVDATLIKLKKRFLRENTI